MKRLAYKIVITLFMCLVCIVTLEKNVTANDEFTVNDVIYRILDRDSVELKEYTGENDTIIIPEIVNGYKVISIGHAAFSGNKMIKEVSLPKSIRRIETVAFSGSTLEKINIPEFVETVGYSVFENTPLYENAGTDVKYVGNICLGVDEKCNLKEINIRKGTRIIADGAFQDNQNITTIHLPDDLKVIGKQAFYCCHNLTTVNIPSSVNIEDNAFYGDRKLTNIIGDTKHLENSQAFSDTPLQTKRFAKEIAKTTVILFVALICFIEVIVYGKRLLCEKEEKGYGN